MTAADVYILYTSKYFYIIMQSFYMSLLNNLSKYKKQLKYNSEVKKINLLAELIIQYNDQYQHNILFQKKTKSN